MKGERLTTDYGDLFWANHDDLVGFEKSLEHDFATVASAVAGACGVSTEELLARVPTPVKIYEQEEQEEEEKKEEARQQRQLQQKQLQQQQQQQQKQEHQAGSGTSGEHVDLPTAMDEEASASVNEGGDATAGGKQPKASSFESASTSPKSFHLDHHDQSYETRVDECGSDRASSTTTMDGTETHSGQSAEASALINGEGGANGVMVGGQDAPLDRSSVALMDIERDGQEASLGDSDRLSPVLDNESSVASIEPAEEGGEANAVDEASSKAGAQNSDMEPVNAASLFPASAISQIRRRAITTTAACCIRDVPTPASSWVSSKVGPSVCNIPPFISCLFLYFLH